MSGTQRGWVTFLVVIFLLAAPTAVSMIWYKVTGNPLLRPLGITKEALQAYYGTGKWTQIVAEVEWDAQRSGRVTKADMKRALERAFAAKGVEVSVQFHPGHAGTKVLYRVGSSYFGPYPQSRAAEGISAVVDAYRMIVPYRP